MQVNIKTAYKTVCDILKDNENYLFETNELVRHFLNASKNDIIFGDKLVNQNELDMLIKMANKRKSGYPLQYILGEWEFFGQHFKVGEGVLIPRADTEALVEVCLDYAKDKNDLKVLDLCSGSGCIAITLKNHIENSKVYALEKSDFALKYLKQNIELNKVDITVLHDDALCPQTKQDDFDIIVSNPPYLTIEDMNGLQKEVTFEPKMALYGNDDGLEFYKQLTKIWTPHLKKGGLLAYEIGQNQHEDVAQILNLNGYNTICNRRDLCDIIRAVYAIK